jgi:thiol-disulfide isomerase/thioredoxin
MQSRQFHSILTRLRTALICFVLLPVLAASAADPGGKIGKLPKDAVANYQIRTLDGQTFSLSGLRGKVVVLDFFAIWCGHSKHHVPSLAEYGEAERKQGLQIIGLAVNDAESTPERVRKFIEEMKIEYPVAMIPDLDFSRYVNSRDVSVPQTLIFARDGRLAAHFAGHNRETEKEMAARINRELERP